MLGLIMAAGLGTRLGVETKDKPKCMVDVGGKPVLERVADYLNKQGVQKIVVNLHSFPDKVIKHFGQRFLYLYEPIPMGEFATVSLIKAWFPGEDILIANGDTIITEVEDKDHCGLTYYYKNGEVEKDTRYKYIDIGTIKGLAEARKKYDRN